MVDALGCPATGPYSMDDEAQIVFLEGEDAISALSEFRPRNAFTAAQHPLWVSNWIKHSTGRNILVGLGSGTTMRFALPLEISRRGPLTVACFMSGRHANGNFPMVAEDFDADPGDCADKILKAIRTTLPELDLLALERQWESLGSLRNPFVSSEFSIPSVDPSLAVSLEGGMEAVLSRASGKRNKKHRSQARKFEAAGGWRRFQATSEEQVAALLAEFIQMKIIRFQKLGISNPFAETHVQTFFRGLFSQALRDVSPSFVLHGLEVGGRLRAVTGSSIVHDRIICEFSAFADDGALSGSPGDFLFFENIAEACQDGREFYDFSVGDDFFKRVWCNDFRMQHNTYIPLSSRGKLAAMGLRTTGNAMRKMKANHRIRQTAKEVRRIMSSFGVRT